MSGEAVANSRSETPVAALADTEQDAQVVTAAQVEWGYRLPDDPYVCAMSSEDAVRRFIGKHLDGAVVVRRVIGKWEEADDA